MERAGNVALIGVLVIGGAAAGLYLSPDLAEAVLPPQLLGAHPGYDTADSGTTCTNIEQVEAGEEALRDFFDAPAEEGSTTRSTVCGATCDAGPYVADYCDSDDQFICVCRTANSQ